METFDKVAAILSELSGYTEIKLEQVLKTDLGLESLQMVTLLIMLEESFQIVLSESDMNPFDLLCVEHVVNLVEKYLGGDDNGKTEKED